MVQNPQFLINIRKNINSNNQGYGKHYPKAVEKETYIKKVTPLEDWITKQLAQG